MPQKMPGMYIKILEEILTIRPDKCLEIAYALELCAWQRVLGAEPRQIFERNARSNRERLPELVLPGSSAEYVSRNRDAS